MVREDHGEKAQPITPVEGSCTIVNGGSGTSIVEEVSIDHEPEMRTPPETPHSHSVFEDVSLLSLTLLKSASSQGMSIKGPQDLQGGSIQRL